MLWALRHDSGEHEVAEVLLSEFLAEKPLLLPPWGDAAMLADRREAPPVASLSEPPCDDAEPPG